MAGLSKKFQVEKEKHILNRQQLIRLKSASVFHEAELCVGVQCR